MPSLPHLQVDTLVSELSGKPARLSYYLLNCGMETCAGTRYDVVGSASQAGL